MSWKKEIKHLELRKFLAKKLGGKEKIKRQHDAGRLTVRERIDYLVDRGSFEEIGILAGNSKYDDNGELISFTPSNSIIGHALISNKPVVVYGDDFTIRGGAADASIWEKMIAV